MSYRIEYQYKAHRVLARLTHDNIDRFFICIEGGDNNCYESGGRRARDWGVCMIGTHDEVLEEACRSAADCEGGGLKPMNKSSTAEAYVARIRKLMAATGRSGYPDNDVRLRLVRECDIGSKDDLTLQGHGIARIEKASNMKSGMIAEFNFKNEDGEPDFHAFFRLQRLLATKPAWSVARCMIFS